MIALKAQAEEYEVLRAILIATTFMISASAAAAQSADIFGNAGRAELGNQDIDANKRLLEALSKAAKKGPVFRLNPDRVLMEFREGGSALETLRITNVGDENGPIRGVTPIGAIDGLNVTNNCPPELIPGAFCDIVVKFSSEKPQSVQTVLVASIKERERSSIDIPVRINVTPAPIAEPVSVKPDASGDAERAAEAKKLDELRRRVAELEAQKGPDTNGIANRYLNGIGGAYSTDLAEGIIVVSKPQNLRSASVAGVSQADIRISKELTDKRYDKEIPFTESSLPVNRDRILTSDRVIKAVLDTPISNVMCGKVVAVIESDVYSATSDRPLIPAGSRAVGSCGTFVGERVGIAWSRILTTDGRSISFDASQTATNDASGLGGGLGRVYRSNFDKFILPLISTMVDTTAGVIFAKFGDDETVVTTPDGNVVQSKSSSNEGLRIVTQEGRASAQNYINEIRDVREVMVLPSGSRIDIELSQDVYFSSERDVVSVGGARYLVANPDDQTIKVSEDARLVAVPAAAGKQGAAITLNGRQYHLIDEPLAVVPAAAPPAVTNPVTQELGAIN